MNVELVRRDYLFGKIVRDQSLLLGWISDGIDRRIRMWPGHSQVWVLEKSSCLQPFCKTTKVSFNDTISAPALQCYNLKRILFLCSFSLCEAISMFLWPTYDNWQKWRWRRCYIRRSFVVLSTLPNLSLRNLEGWGVLDIWRGWADRECKFW
jgi:hypothetical protein